MRKRENWLPVLILIFVCCPAAIMADGWVSTDSASQYGFSTSQYPGEDSPTPPPYTFSVAPDPSRHDMFLYDYANNGQAGQSATDVVHDRNMRWTAEQIRTFNSHYEWNYVHQVIVDRWMYEADSYISTNLYGADFNNGHNEDEAEWEEEIDGYEEKEVGTLYPEFLDSNTDYYVHTHWKQLANGFGQFESQAELTEPGLTDNWHPRGQRSLGKMSYSVSSHSPSSLIWDFDAANNFEGWKPFKTSGAAVNNGILFIDPAGHDPYVEGPDIQASATYYKKVVLDMASNAQDGYGRIYFKTQSSNFYSDDKSVPFTVNHCPPSSCNGGAQFRDYTVNMAVNSKWAGTITGIRVDPANDGRAGTNIDTIGFDSIRLSRHSYADSGEVDFKLVAEQQSQTVTQGGAAQFRIRADFSYGFYGQVDDFVVLNPPSGTNARFDPPTIGASGGSTTLSIETSGSTPTGTSNLVISAGNSNEYYSLVNLELTVKPPSAQVVNIIPNVRHNGQTWGGWIWLRISGPQGVVVDRQVLVPSETFAVPPGSYTIQYVSGGPASASLSQVWAAQPCGATGATGVSCNYTSASLNNGVFFDFSGSVPATYSIGGRVTDSSGAAIGDVQVSVSGTETWYTKTTSAGNYNFYGLQSGGSYTVAPTGSNYNFNPQAVTFHNLTADATADFTGTLRASPAGKIAFTRGYNESAEIWVINADGSGLTQLTHNSVNDAYPTWSPDGTKIAFVSWRDGNKEIYVMDADGSNQRNLTNHYEYDLDPAWSPDGSKIAFHSYRDGNAEIYVMRADGSSTTRLTYSAQTIDSEAAWSPDGTKIVFQRFENYIVDIYTVNVDGTNLRNLTNNPGQSSAPAWSPGGDKIAFTRDGEIFVMNPDGTGQANVTRNPAGDSNPSWSPDGSAITFISYRENQQDLYVMSADGSNQTRLTYTADDDYDPAWQQRAGPEMISVTVQSNPPGRSVTVDGVTFTAPQIFSWVAGTTHTIGTTSTQSGAAGTRYVLEGWSDGGASSHTVSPTASTTFVANYATQFFLTTNAGSGGSVSPPGGWYSSGQSVTISATPSGGFNFGDWSGSGAGSYSGSNNPAAVVMNGPVTETANFTAAPSACTGETVWIDDVAPAGSTLYPSNDGWNWVNSNPSPFSGTQSHRSALVSGQHDHYFVNATNTLPIRSGEVLFAYVYLDPASPPSQLMLSWNDGAWGYRAYWGANLINAGVDGTASRRYMGPLPPAGQWARLEVPAALVGLEGRTLSGMSFMLYNGRATWDRAGKACTLTSTLPQDTIWVGDALPAGATPFGSSDGWNWVGSNPSPYSGSSSHQSANMSGYHDHYFQDATNTLTVNAGDSLLAYVYLDPTSPPSEIMLSWNDGAWGYRAYWGANLINVGTDGTASRRYMGPLPPTGRWVRLEVPADLVGLAGRTLRGLSFIQYNGRATWDNVGKTAPSETIWVEDSVPVGANTYPSNDGWNWVNSNPSPFSGSFAHQSPLIAGAHDHYFLNATNKLQVNVGDRLFAYVYLDPASPPSQLMLSWNDGAWGYRAYWGANLINAGVDGTASRRYMGPLPPAGQWARLEVPAALVGLEGRTLSGMSFMLYNGRATWDRAGKLRPSDGRVNHALSTNGAVATALSNTSAEEFAPMTFPAIGAINGNNKGDDWGRGGAWRGGTGVFPNWLQIDFAGPRAISEINVFTTQDALENSVQPSLDMSFATYGMTDFQVQYWDGVSWQNVPSGSVVGNNKVWRQFQFSPITTSRIRVHCYAGLANAARIVEVEAWDLPARH